MQLRTLAQLVRLPAVFTLIADVLLGYWFVSDSLEPYPIFAALLLSSLLMYMAGMVLNDVFDVEQDRRERPERPIPSGRISYGAAHTLGFALLIVGWGVAMGVGITMTGMRGIIFGTLLATAVVAYDWRLKRTWMGPIAMGICRYLNLLMVMSVLPEPFSIRNYMLAGGIGLYITGITWFARREAAESKSGVLAAATIVMLAGLTMLYSLLWFLPRADLTANLANEPMRWHLVWAIVAGSIVWRCAPAIMRPEPRLVGAAVRNSLTSLILIDAVITWAQRDIGPAIAIAALLLPMMLVGRWFSAT